MWSPENAERVATVVVCSPVGQRLDAICEWLVEQKYALLPAATAAAASQLCRYARPQLLIVDLDLPNDSGLDLLRERAEADFPEVPVLLLIDRGFDYEATVTGEPLLAVDDTLRKPFDPHELTDRLTTILLRRHSRGDVVARVGELVVDPPRRKVLVGDRDVHLAKKEFSLLRVLASDPTRVFSKDELLLAVWGLRYPGGGTRTLDSHASRLRNKLDREHRRFVANCWGIGYRLVDSIDDAGPVISDAEEERR
jgi:DNA-binding response OmpR family regulator